MYVVFVVLVFLGRKLFWSCIHYTATSRISVKYIIYQCLQNQMEMLRNFLQLLLRGLKNSHFVNAISV